MFVRVVFQPTSCLAKSVQSVYSSSI